MIPKLDWRRFSEETDKTGFVADLSAALRGPGIFRLSGHGVEPGLIDDVFALSAEVFDLTEAEKRTLSMRPGPYNRGWTRLGEERLADGSSAIERREAYNIGLELPQNAPGAAQRPSTGTQTPWPSIPRFRQVMQSYFDAMLDLGAGLHQAIAADLGLPETHFKRFFADPLATLRLVTYPPATGLGGETGAGVHTDPGSLSFLVIGREPGLQVQLRSGEWVDMAPMKHSVIVLVGDCLERWTGGAYAATPHRVHPPRNRRYAINFYVDPAQDAPMSTLPELGQPEPRPQSFGSFLGERLASTLRGVRR